jgi:hypothetical protein
MLMTVDLIEMSYIYLYVAETMSGVQTADNLISDDQMVANLGNGIEAK